MVIHQVQGALLCVKYHQPEATLKLVIELLNIAVYQVIPCQCLRSDGLRLILDIALVYDTTFSSWYQLTEEDRILHPKSSVNASLRF